jgi:transcriptional regulator with XRE-family HTH domain
VLAVSTVTESHRETREKVARNLVQQRKRAGISTRRLARESGVDERLLRRYEAATHQPSTTNLLRISAVIGQSLEWFYGNHDDGARDG